MEGSKQETHASLSLVKGEGSKEIIISSGKRYELDLVTLRDTARMIHRDVLALRICFKHITDERTMYLVLNGPLLTVCYVCNSGDNTSIDSVNAKPVARNPRLSKDITRIEAKEILNDENTFVLKVMLVDAIQTYYANDCDVKLLVDELFEKSTMMSVLVDWYTRLFLDYECAFECIPESGEFTITAHLSSYGTRNADLISLVRVAHRLDIIDKGVIYRS